MIYSLSGVLLEKHEDMVLLEVQGVGYGVHVSLSTLSQLPSPGRVVRLHTHLVVREDDMSLYGFASVLEKEMFLILIQVNKVGPKLALSMLSAYDVETLARCIIEKDVDMLQRISGVGRRMAERLVGELHDRLPSHWVLSTTQRAGSSVESEVVLALRQLGYEQAEIQKALSQVDVSQASDVSEILKMVLGVMHV